MSLEDSDIDGRLGNRIRRLRAAQSLTLEGLAERSRVSRAMLSRIERGEASPTAQLLNRVCGGLGITLSALFAGAEAAPNPLSRRAEQSTWRDPASGYLRRRISAAGTGSPVDIVEVDFPPGGSVAFDAQHLSGVDQHVWLLDGALDLEIGDERVRLTTGDCLMMRLDRPVLFRNPTTRPTRYAVVISHGIARP